MSSETLLPEIIHFYMNQGDLLPVLNAVAVDGDDEVVNLTGYSSVKFQMEHLFTKEQVLDTATGASIPTPGSGTLRYTPQAGMSADPGDYEICWEVTFSGNPLTFPNREDCRAILHIKRQVA